MRNLTVIIPYRDNRAGLTRLLGTLPTDLPVIVVDDCSAVPPDAPGTTVIRTSERGYFSGAVNTGIQACRTDVLILNQDVWFPDGDGWLEAMAEWPGRYAIVGDGVKHRAWPGYVQGTFMWMAREAIDAVGLLDAKHWPLWGATGEWQARACRKGYKALPIMGLDWFQHERRKRYGSSITRLLEEQPGKRDWFIRTPPLVSVVVPCYNYGRYLGDALASLVGGDSSIGWQPGQTFQGFEVVIVDDASTDDSAEIIRGLVNPWAGIRGLQMQRNGGTAQALNAGVRASHGRYIQILSADDMLAPDALERHLAAIEEEPSRLVYGDHQILGDGGLAEVWKMAEYDFDKLIARNHVPAMTMFAKAAWQGVGGYPAEFGDGREDWAFAVAMGRAGYCGHHVSAVSCWYRRQGQNRTLTNTSPAHHGQFLEKLRVRFPDIYAGERPMGCCGKRRSAIGAPRRTTAAAAAAAPRPGERGLTLLEFTGQTDGRTIWFGPVTGIRYTFKATRRVAYVDNRDVPEMLEMRYNRKVAFKIHQRHALVPTAEIQPEPEPEPVADVAAVVEPIPAAEIEVAPEPEPAAEPKPKRKYTRRKKVDNA